MRHPMHASTALSTAASPEPAVSSATQVRPRSSGSSRAHLTVPGQVLFERVDFVASAHGELRFRVRQERSYTEFPFDLVFSAPSFFSGALSFEHVIVRRAEPYAASPKLPEGSSLYEFVAVRRPATPLETSPEPVLNELGEEQILARLVARGLDVELAGCIGF